jgi:hypothetical protein
MTKVKAKDANRDVEVGGENSDVVIDWPANCGGGTRAFAPDDLRAHISNVERIAALGDDLWYEARDSHGMGFVCRLAAKRFYAHETFRDDMPNVSWSVFKRAMEARIK